MADGFFSKLGEALTGFGAAEERGYAAGVDERTARDAAMETARLRREQRRKTEAERFALNRQAKDRQAVHDYYADPTATFEGGPLGAIITGGFGSDYAGAGLGLQRGQDVRFREALIDPDVEEAARRRYMEAIEPGTALREIAGGDTNEPLESVIDHDTGKVILVPRSQAAGMERGFAPSRAMTPEERAIAEYAGGYARELGYRSGADPEQADYLSPQDAMRALDELWQIARSDDPEQGELAPTTDLAQQSLSMAEPYLSTQDWQTRLNADAERAIAAGADPEQVRRRMSEVAAIVEAYKAAH